MPGTMIPVVDESRLYDDQPEYALRLSWHIANELSRSCARTDSAESTLFLFLFPGSSILKMVPTLLRPGRIGQMNR
jgi:hypothetical protein